MNHFVYPKDDLKISAAIFVIIFGINKVVPYMGFEDRKKKKDGKDPETHIVYHILFSILGYIAFLHFLNTMQIEYGPFHCKDEICNFEPLSIFSEAQSEIFYMLGMIFSLGPIRLFLKIQEGKTSLSKIKEDYEDQRTSFLDDAIRRQQA